VTLHKHFNEIERAERDRKLLQSAATIELVDPPEEAEAGQNLRVRVKVENVGAGHKLPTGFPEGREAWVDFQVMDEGCNEIFRLGAIKDGHTEEGTKSFKAILGDRSGKVVDLDVWEADRILSDTRILPKGFAQVEYVFQVPRRAKGSLRIVADLNYMSFPQFILDELFGAGTIKSEVVLIGSVTHAVKIKN